MRYAEDYSCNSSDVKLRSFMRRLQLTTTIPLQFVCNLKLDRAIREFYLLWAAALRHKWINKSAWLPIAGYVSVTLITFDKHSSARRTAVES